MQLRFDIVYHTHFKCNKKKIREYPNLWAYTRDIFQMEGVVETFNEEETRKHYFGLDPLSCICVLLSDIWAWLGSHLKLNPSGIVAKGPADYVRQLMDPHTRDTL